MKFIRSLSSIALLSCLSINSGAAVAKMTEQISNPISTGQTEPVMIAGGNTLIGEVTRQILTEIGTEAAREMLRRLFTPRPEKREAAFSDGEWLVAISNNGNDYYGVNLKTRNSLTLRGARVSANSQRQVYTWNNGDYRYQVAWQPADPQVIRLQVFDGRGKERLNRLLYQTNG